MQNKPILLLLLLVFFLACTPSKKHQINFYYWKTNYALSANTMQLLQKCKTQKIYLHCFDIVSRGNDEIPAGVLLFKQKPLANIHYIPTIFIENKCMQNDENVLAGLSNKALQLITQIMTSQNLSFDEINVDCDWTESTKGNYFFFLEKLKAYSHKNISSTLRLYQLKYANKAGVPPCQNNILMCYNMGNINDLNENNSILDTKILQTYIHRNTTYATTLKIALPIFNWVTIFRDSKLSGLTYNKDLLSNKYTTKISENKYCINQNYYDTISNFTYQKGDILKWENPKESDIVKSIALLENTQLQLQNEIILFDLDSNNIKNYNIEKFN